MNAVCYERVCYCYELVRYELVSRFTARFQKVAKSCVHWYEADLKVMSCVREEIFCTSTDINRAKQC